MPYKYVRLRRLALFSLITGLFALGAALLARIPAVAETVFAKGISRAYITAVGYVTSALPFSLFELLVALAVVLAAVTLGRWIYWGVRHKKLKILQSFLRVVAVVMTVVAVYVLTATCNYHRAPVEDVPAADLSADELEDAANLFLADFNALAHTVQRDSDGKLINPYGFQGLCNRIRAQYQTLGDYYNSFTPTPKKLLFSDVVSAFGIIGISFQPTAEANINTNTPDGALPPLIAHELAHNKGVMREEDANLIAAYLTLTSDDPYLRYTGYLDTFGELIVALRLHKKDALADELLKQIDPLIRRDQQDILDAYAAFDSWINDVGTFFNNLYLKLSGIEAGVGSYRPDGSVVITPAPDGTLRPTVRYSPIQQLYGGIYRAKTA